VLLSEGNNPSWPPAATLDSRPTVGCLVLPRNWAARVALQPGNLPYLGKPLRKGEPHVLELRLGTLQHDPQHG
jgi:hypothetical protein